jgi:cobalamin biosynthesis Mg chelatase CobN
MESPINQEEKGNELSRDIDHILCSGEDVKKSYGLHSISKQSNGTSMRKISDVVKSCSLLEKVPQSQANYNSEMLIYLIVDPLIKSSYQKTFKSLWIWVLILLSNQAN